MHIEMKDRDCLQLDEWCVDSSSICLEGQEGILIMGMLKSSDKQYFF